MVAISVITLELIRMKYSPPKSFDFFNEGNISAVYAFKDF